MSTPLTPIELEPVRGPNGYVPLARLQMRDGSSVSVCNAIEGVLGAMMCDCMFMANEVLGGYQEHQILVNPAHVAIVRATRESERR